MKLQMPHAPYSHALSTVQRVSLAVPSGQGIELFEVLIDEVGAEVWLRFRFVAPAIGKDGAGLAYEDVLDDFEHLCARVALPYMDDYALQADVVVIAMLNRKVDFGVADPDVTQFVEAFRIEGALCAPEGDW
jgi:hypothetical protein